MESPEMGDFSGESSMQASRVILSLVIVFSVPLVVQSSQTLDRARALEKKGDALGARNVLAPQPGRIPLGEWLALGCSRCLAGWTVGLSAD
jgi:hypothetical protein